jgi:hypothetical protein
MVSAFFNQAESILAEERVMKIKSRVIQGVLVVAGILMAVEAYPQELSEQCTQQLGGKDIKMVFVINHNASLEIWRPYHTTLPDVEFPLKVTQILGAPKMFTVTPYLVNPEKALVCWINPITGKYQCK